MSGDWRPLAACLTADPGLFFGADDETQRDRQARVTQAKAVCAGCSVRLHCHQGATARGEIWGVWGGENFETARPAVPEPPVLCGKGLHLMTAENTKPVAGTSQVRCRECWRITDRRTRSARDARRRQRRQERRRVA